MRPVLALFALLIWLQPAQASGVESGVWAYRAGNYPKAVAIIRPLAEEGDPFAQYSMGVMYDDGRGVPRNFKLALLWYKKAGSQGLADAQYMAGRFYGSGRGIKQDPAAALFWFELASAAGHPLAPLLRDQHYNQLKGSVRERVAADATRWQSEHPVQLTCKWKICIFPSWTSKPGWTVFDQNP